MSQRHHSSNGVRVRGGSMGTQTSIVTANGTERRARRHRSKQERRQIVEETFKPGASVALVARVHGVNANQLFKWRRLYQQGRLADKAPVTLLPVKVTDTIPVVQSKRQHRSKIKRSGIIDIDLGHARIRIEGTADPDCIRATLEGLSR
jgi:transposase